MDCGDTFLFPLHGSRKAHLWIVVTQPDEAGLCVIVMVTTLRADRDQTLILRSGDHPFIRHDSVVSYGDAQIIDARGVESAIARGEAARKERCSPGTLRLIQDGLLASPFTRPKVLRFCRDRWGR